MARYSMETLMRDFARDRERFVAKHPHSVLMFSPVKAATPCIETTLVGRRPAETERGEPVFVEVIKGAASAFPFGVTIGHAENNDVVLTHRQVSRFHAYIKEGPTGRALVDAESTNGTYLDGVRLAPTKATPLPGEARISFGGVEVTYLEPPQLAARLAQMVGQRPALE